MSEYQYYEFVAIDRPLGPAQLEELRSISTRAQITPTSFVNEYEWGDLKADPRALVQDYFDAFLYTSNWGTRRLIIRLPARLLDLPTATQYCSTESASAWAHGENVIIELSRDLQDDDWDEDEYGAESLTSIIPVRAELAAGDLRLLYLGWLLAADAGELDDDVLEPPVPANLADLSGALGSVVDFLRLDEDLLDIAAEASADQTGEESSGAELATWIEQLPAAEKDALLLSIARGQEAHPRAELLRRFTGQSAPHEPVQGRRSVGELLGSTQQFQLGSPG